MSCARLLKPAPMFKQYRSFPVLLLIVLFVAASLAACGGRRSGGFSGDGGTSQAPDTGVIPDPPRNDAGEPLCMSVCTPDERRCNAGDTRVDICAYGPLGCTQWETLEVCSGSDTCRAGRCGSGFEFTPTTTVITSGEALVTAEHSGLDMAIAEECACFYGDYGFSTVSACVAQYTTRTRTSEYACYASVYDAASEVNRRYRSCLTRLYGEIDDCLAIKGCGEDAAECFAEDWAIPQTLFDHAATSCKTMAGATSSDLDAFERAMTSCRIGSGADTCGVSAASSAVGSSVFTGTTTGKGDHRTPSRYCTTSATASPDVTHAWTPPETGTYSVDLVGSEFDGVVSVITSCATGLLPSDGNYNCDFARPTRGMQATISDITLTAGTTYYIVVDGLNEFQHGRYIVNIARVD